MASERADTHISHPPNDYFADHFPGPEGHGYIRRRSLSVTSESQASFFSANELPASPPPSFTETAWTSDRADLSDELPKYGSLPPEELALTSDPIFHQHIFVSGGTRTPDLSVTSSDNEKLYHFETDSTLVYHETYVKDLRGPYALFNIRRHPVKNKPDGAWRYTIHLNARAKSTKGNGGTKIFEMDTDPGMLLGGRDDRWQSTLVFRNARTSELDGLTLCVTQEGSSGKGLAADVLYEGKKVADIIDLRHRREPSYEIRIFRRGLDPLLVIMMAYVIDDRIMGNKRRYRRGRTVPGVGKVPGASLAGVYRLAVLT